MDGEAHHDLERGLFLQVLQLGDELAGVLVILAFDAGR